MVHPITTQKAIMPGHGWLGAWPLSVVAGIAAVCAGLFAGALLLWAHYGTAVFFEMIASGVSACF
jgi:hypothetical protein